MLPWLTFLKFDSRFPRADRFFEREVTCNTSQSSDLCSKVLQDIHNAVINYI